MQALTANNSFESELEESRVDLDNKSYQIQK